MDNEDRIEQACEWVEALASNEYNQGTGVMHSEYTSDADAPDWPLVATAAGKMCCLGVLRLLAAPDADYDGVIDEGEPEYWERKEYGLTDAGQEHLVVFNDTDGLSFPEIAVELVSDPSLYFTPVVALGVKEYFWT